MSQLVTLSPADIKARVNQTNSFTKDEIVLYRPLITAARAEKRERLAKMTGSNVGTIVDGLKTSHNAVVADMKHIIGVKQQKWTITLTAKVHKSDTDLLKERAMRLQKQLNEVENKIEELNATPVSSATAETAATA